jgi:hypothetical protein
MPPVNLTSQLFVGGIEEVNDSAVDWEGSLAGIASQCSISNLLRIAALNRKTPLTAAADRATQ